MNRTPTERRSIARRNASQTRPDQTRGLVTQFCGLSLANQVQIATAVTREAAAIGFGANR